ncbi:hypothetical protein D3C78_1312910 [compost metagenome]
MRYTDSHGRTSAAATGPRFARAALIDAQADVFTLHDLHKSDIRPLRKALVAFHDGAEDFYGGRINIINLNHAVGISHRDDAAQYCLLGRAHNIGLFRFDGAKRYG